MKEADVSVSEVPYPESEQELGRLDPAIDERLEADLAARIRDLENWVVEKEQLLKSQHPKPKGFKPRMLVARSLIQPKKEAGTQLRLAPKKPVTRFDHLVASGLIAQAE